jgi:tetratricopeptide (TPR) repeat protein
MKTVAVSAVITMFLAAAVWADTVELTKNASLKVPGGQIKGAISSETSTEVKIADKTVPVEDIASVSYDGTTASFALASTRENSGNLTEAASLYQKAVAEASGKPLLARAAAFGHAQALAELALASPARASEAMAALDAFVRANANCRQLAPALELQAKLALMTDNVSKADAAVADLGKIPWAADRAVILKSRVLGKQKKYDQAIADLDKLISAAPAKSPKAVEAKMAKAESLAGLKKFDDAEKLINDVTNELPPEDPTQAIAHNTLGDCLRAAGRSKEALFEYLKTDILYDRDKEQHQRALAQIAQVWRDLKQDGRADETLEKLKQLYPNSPYLSQRGGK